MNITNWFSTTISFDGHLTESTTYQQFEQMAYLTGKTNAKTKQNH